MESPKRSFTPPFCPATDCRYFRSTAGWRYRRIGCYHRQASPTRFQRYRCGHCGRRFSTQTFSTTYWLRRPELLQPITHRLLGCSAYRQIAREFAVSPQTVLGQAARLGRHGLMFQHHHRLRGVVREPLVLDGFAYHVTSGTARRTTRNPLFPVNLLDLLQRRPRGRPPCGSLGSL